jgi:hypothetical protein
MHHRINSSPNHIMAGYSETPLLKKLGIKPNHVVLVIHEPESYWKDLGALPQGVQLKSKPGKNLIDFAHLFVKEKKVYEKEVLNLRRVLQPNGMIWVSWPKKSSKVVSDMDENVIRNFALKMAWWILRFVR